MSPAHHRAAALVVDVLGTKPAFTRAPWTWGPTVVVEATIDDDLTVFIRAAKFHRG